MLIRLVQNDFKGEPKTVDIASSVDKLDFSDLSGSSAWRVHVVWDAREECIAHVIWEPSMTYRIHVQHDGVSNPAQIIERMDAIIPTVKSYLEQMFQRTAINQMYKHQPMIVVQPDIGVA